jgi:hypothetical protein
VVASPIPEGREIPNITSGFLNIFIFSPLARGQGAKGIIRYYSTVKGNIKNSEILALEHIKSGNVTTYLVINNILANQRVSISENKLKDLLKVKGVEVDLPVTDSKSFGELVGKSAYKGFFGVYLFIHKLTDQTYVGSSNLLRRRMDYYFKGDFPTPPGPRGPSAPCRQGGGGKFLPILRKEGLGTFKLVIFKLDNNIFNVKDALFLEQYFLLSKNSNLNTLKVVNFGPSAGKGVYVYNLDCSILYYHAKSQIELKRVLNVHPESCVKYVDTKNPYLNNFLLLSFPIPSALPSDKSVKEILYIMERERKALYTLGTRRSLSVLLEIREGNTFVDPKISGNKLEFSSLTLCIKYLRNLGIIIKRDTLSKYIKKAKVFHNFFCKYLDESLPADFEKLGLLIEEHKHSKKDSVNKPINKKNKPILVRSCVDNTEIATFTSITDTLRYFDDSLGIKLDRKTLNNRLTNGKEYKGFYFIYK